MIDQLLLSSLIFTTFQPGYLFSALSRACAAVGQVIFENDTDFRPAYTAEATSVLAFAGRDWADDIMHATSSATTLMAWYIEHSLLDSSQRIDMARLHIALRALNLPYPVSGVKLLPLFFRDFSGSARVFGWG